LSTLKLAGQVRFKNPPGRVYERLRRSLLESASGQLPSPDAVADPATFNARFRTRLPWTTATTTQRVTLSPNKSLTREHLAGPLKGSREAFRLEQTSSGGTLVRYSAAIEPAAALLKGPLEWLWVGPQVRKSAIRWLMSVRKDLEGD
jgi:hypothetical protein